MQTSPGLSAARSTWMTTVFRPYWTACSVRGGSFRRVSEHPTFRGKRAMSPSLPSSTPLTLIDEEWYGRPPKNWFPTPYVM